MPNNTYRRKLRANVIYTDIAIKNIHSVQDTLPTCTPTSILPIYIQTLPAEVERQKGDCDIDKIRNYFYKVIDMIIEHSKFTETAVVLNDIIQTVSTQVEYYRIMELIETNLLSTVVNISENVNSNIIGLRIEYIKTYINELPPMCQETGPISKMILEVIESIIQSVSFEKVTRTIEGIQTYIQDTYGSFEKIETIQTNLLSIIENIGNGVTTPIISLRVNFVKDMILQC